MAKRAKPEAQGKKATNTKRRKRKLSPTRKPEDMTLEQWQVALRREYGREQNFEMENIGDHRVFSEFAVTNPETERTYRVAIRGTGLGVNYCSCPDFAVNTLGTCKHIEFALARLGRSKRRRAQLERGYTPPYSEVYLRYGSRRRVVFSAGTEAPEGLRRLAGQFFDDEGVLREEAFARFDVFQQRAQRWDHEVRCYDDALAFIAEVRDAARRRAVVAEHYENGKGRSRILEVPLYPYQREGALFAAKAGRALIADDMGLGKTPQAIAAVEVLAEHFGVERVLIVCPASLKYQWKAEIERFCGRSATVIEGRHHQRRELYRGDAFYRIANYEVIYRDLEAVLASAPDLVILDEAQRIKNWQTRTAKSIKRLDSPYAIVLTGTPLENRLEELHSIVEFVDRHRLGPLFRFTDAHQIRDEDTGRVVGYHDLNAISKTLAPILVRRTKAEVLDQLPERMDKTFLVPMTREQWIPHEENREIVARLAAKWRRHHFLSEADRRRLLVALQYMRMACDNTYLIDQKTCFGPKLDELATFLAELFERPEAKVVVFSQWKRMNDLVAQRLEDQSQRFLYLHGGVPSKKRKGLLEAFHEDPDARVFLSTDAGGTGLNLQSASTVVNLDLPWNPAVLEQRIGRVHRIGQHRPVQVVNFVSEGTIEHGMLSVLAFKKSVFDGVLDGGEDHVFLDGSRLKKFMDQVERVSGAVPTTAHEPPPEPEEPEPERPAEQPPPQEPAQALQPLMEAGAAFFKELGRVAAESRAQGRSPLDGFVQTDEGTGKPCLKIPVPDQKTLETAASALGSLLEAFAGRSDADRR
ncbi:MAG: DEAD/DEAH box helicase [Planctomycetota bacterium]